MVRKASRLAPGQQSVEEVLLNRLANGESATLTTRSSTALPSNCSTRRSQALTAPRGTAADRRLSGSNRAGVHMSTAPAGTGVKSSARAAAIGLTGAPPMSMEFMQQISSEIANLDQRLQRVATNLAAAPSRETEKRTATSSNDERNVHQLGIEKFLQSSIQEVANTHKTGGSEDNARRSTSVNPKASAQVTYSRALRENTVEEWHAYSRRIYTIPFRRWYVFMARRRAARLAKESICVAYERRQRRHIKYNFFRLWKHQVLFGHIEGLHSKVHLLRSLEDQKRMCIGLEANAVLYRDNIAALQASIVQLEDKLMEKQQELAQLHETTQATRFGIHQAEQSIARVQGMLEAVRIVHPGTVERVETMYRDNPLLSKDLKDVISLHANKRRELLSKIELDRTELEVQNASKGAGTQEDQMLLHRVKWVLSRLDLGMHEQTGNNQHDTRMTGNRVETMNQLCALFEFIRNGDTVPLAPVNNPEHREQMQHSRSMDSMVRFNNSDDGIVRRADIMDDSNTWHSFLQSLVIKFVPDNLLSVKERLVRRAADMDAEVAEIKANPQLHHLYR
ncbi:hypothetical protein PC129_g1172 [Phytophthora cactorum]|uniref:Uncharacterized protein n=1 Tax=Phytophthora cactorum TaxID=29920 RepID=A0A8T1IW82_9STRA|nr:hypothetical protein PC129_g1172 [Phytophthora cactorum]